MKLITCRVDGCRNQDVGILWDFDAKLAEAQREGYTLAMPVCGGGCNQTITDIIDAAPEQVDAALAASGSVDPVGGFLEVPPEWQEPNEVSDAQPVTDETAASTEPTTEPPTEEPTA